ncbi:MAG: SRPBCC family protein [Proteobacteria bacterium]|nr:SRPBCC family protein [Pseudomonadota bacterium]
MASITLNRTVDAPVERVWGVLSDFGGIHRYHPGVETSPITAGTPSSGVGSERVCNLYDGNNLRERVTESVHGKRLVIEVVDSSMPMKSAGGAFDLRATGEGKTELTITMDYALKFGALGMIMDKLVLERSMTKALDAMLAGLNQHMRTGETIGKGWKPARVA